MGFTEEYYELRKKRKKETETKGKEDIAPLFVNKTAPLFMNSASAIANATREKEEFAPVTVSKDEEEKRTWFRKGALDDGYQFGDVTKTILGTINDTTQDIMAGAAGIAESAIDAGAYLAGGVGKAFGAEEFAERTKKFIKKDIIDEEAAGALYANYSSPGWIANILNGERDKLNPLKIREAADASTMEAHSVLGDKADSLMQSGGQLAGTLGLQAVGVPWFLTSGVTSFGGGVEEAFNEDASYLEAGGSALVSAGAEILTEKLFGGSGLGETGLIDLAPLTKGIANKAVKALADYGINMASEGAEEVVAGFFQNLGSALYKEENLGDILFSEEAVDGYIEAAIGGAALGGAMNVGKVIDSVHSGRDYHTELNEDEQRVVDKVYEDRVAEAEKDGKLSNKDKKKIHDEVVRDMEKGYLSTDTIEEVLGGEEYNDYRRTVETEEALKKELDELRNMKSADMNDIQKDRLAELKARNFDDTTRQDSYKERYQSKVQDLVRGTHLAESFAERGRRGQAFEADVTKYDAKQQAVIQKAVDSGILNNTRRTHEFVDMIAKISADKGVSFDFTNNDKLKTSGFAVDGKSVNGYVTKDGVTINTNSAKALNSVLGHEITHVLEGTELHTELQTAIVEYAKTKGEYQERYNAISKLYEGVEGANIDAELTADLVGDYLFTDSDFINNLSTNHGNVFQKIYDEVKYLCKVATAGSREARELEKVKRAFDKAYKASTKAQTSGTRFSLSKSVEETKDLMALHNLQSSELLKTLDLGGLPMPSIAVIKAGDGHDMYGDVSLIIPKEAIDPKASKNNKIYGGDAWTPTYPRIEYKPNAAVEKKISNKYYELGKKYGYDDIRPMMRYVHELEDTLNRTKGEAAMLEELYKDTDMMNVYLLDSGKGKVQPVVKETVTEISPVEAEMNQFLIDALGADMVAGFKVPDGQSPMTYRKDFMAQHEAEIEEAYKRYLVDVHGFTDTEVDNVLSNTSMRDLMKLMRDAYQYTQNNGTTVRTETDRAATEEAIRKAASDGYKEWVDSLFKGAEEKSGIRNNADYYTQSGNPRRWEALHWENTLENVVKVMRQQQQTGADAIFGGTAIWGVSAKEYGSIKDVKADSHRLRKMSEEEYEAVRQSYADRFQDIASRIADKGERNQFIANDNAMEAIVDAVRVSKTKAGILKELQQYRQLNVTETDVDDIVSLVADIAEMPTGYFEAKPRRAVGLDEVGVFVIPNNADATLKQELLNRGYSIAEYDPNIEGDRQRVTNQFEEYKFSLSNTGDGGKAYGNYNVYGKDVALETEPEAAPVAPVAEAAPTAETAPVAEAAPTESLADIVNNGRRDDLRGAYNYEGKQYLTDGSFIAEFNTVDDTINQVDSHHIKMAPKRLADAFERSVPGSYFLTAQDMAGFTDGYVKVGESLFDVKYVKALLNSIENPTSSLSAVPGGHNALIISGDNGRAVLMPVRAGDNVQPVYEAKLIHDDAAPLPTTIDVAEQAVGQIEGEFESLAQALADGKITDDEFATQWADINARYEAAKQERDVLAGDEEARAASLGDEIAPPEVEAPYYENRTQSVEDPFDEREYEGIGNQKVKAYMYENPEVKPFFQEEAKVMLGELEATTKGQRLYNPHAAYEYGNESAWTGVKRFTSESIEEMLDGWGLSYADIEKGLRAIIEDNGAENIAAAKKIEFMLNQRLMDGYTDFLTGIEVPANQEYLDMLRGQQAAGYTPEALDDLVANAGRYAPAAEDIAPVKTAPQAAPAPLHEEASGQQAMFDKEQPKQPKQQPKQQTGNQRTAQVLTEEPAVAKDKPGAWSWFKNAVLDKGLVFEDTGDRELQARWNSIRYAVNKAQRLMEKGNASVSSLDSIRKAVEKTGKTKQFYEYLYHLHNVDRMSLEARYPDGKNMPVFGENVTADISRETAARLEKQNPQFKQYAKDVYDYMTYLRELMVDNGVISRETANLWAEMYPHYVPIRRAGEFGQAINVPLDTGRTGVNAPVKRAKGGSQDILPLFDTMGQRTIQTFRAIAKNRFGVELKNTIGTTIASEAMGLDETIDSIDTQDGLLQEGKNGKAPTFTVFENGKRVTFEITEEMYDAMKPTSNALAYTNKAANAISNIRRGMLTEYNPWFMLKNAVKDVQDILINSQHPARTYAAIPKAIKQMATNGHWYAEYMENGGEQNSYFDSETNTFAKPNKALEAAKTVTGLNAISKANNVVERLPRLAEYIASREAGRSVDVAMLDAARVTTNFAAGGDLTKFLNRNGATFLNASVQGAMQQARNIREAKANGLKGWAALAGKFAVAGLPTLLLNQLIWGDDEEYEELSDYVKRDYYIVGKDEDGKFVRIPKGRTVAVIQDAVKQIANAATGNDEVDLKAFLDLVLTNLAPNNPLDNNILSPILQVANNETWYGEDLVPSRLQDMPKAEQYDETTDVISRWLGETFNISPYKANYLIDQYSGVIGDTFLPMLTPEAESESDTFAGELIAPLKDMFTTDGVLKNQNVSDFYELKDELAVNANSSYATDEDALKSKYMNAVNAELSELYRQKREIQNSALSDGEKYEAVRDIQKQIADLTREAIDSHTDVSIRGLYATVGDRQYRMNQNTGAWEKLTDKQVEKQDEVTSGLGITPEEYWANKEEHDFAYEYPGKHAIANSVGGYNAYRGYSSELNDIHADKDEDGDSIVGSRKEKVIDWLNEQDMDYGMRLILFKSEYKADDDYNAEIVQYLDSRNDITWEEMKAILEELDFEVGDDGTISWD